MGKSQVEIVNAVKVIVEGEKITPGQAALLDKLKIRPFYYKMEILNILDHGEVYPAKVLSITHDSILESFGKHAQNVAAVSLAAGIANQASVHHMMLNAFKHLACASMASGFGFKEADRIAAAAAAGPAAGAPLPLPLRSRRRSKRSSKRSRTTSTWVISSEATTEQHCAIFQKKEHRLARRLDS